MIDKKRAFVFASPVLSIGLLGAAWLLAQRQPAAPAVIRVSLDDRIAHAQALYDRAKRALAEDRASEAIELARGAQDELDWVRSQAGEPDADRRFPFEELSERCSMLIVSARKR